MLTAIVGINWGDEGKGRMVDLLSSDYDIICRYQGGNNAGHTVVNDKGKCILNLLSNISQVISVTDILLSIVLVSYRSQFHEEFDILIAQIINIFF